MDDKLKKDLESLAHAERLKDEETYKGNKIATGIEVNEEIEENEYLLRKYKKQFKLFRGIFFAGLVTVIVLLLYTIYTIVTLPDTSKPAEVIEEVVEPEPPAPEPEPVQISQKFLETNWVFQLGLPDIDMKDVKKTSLGKLADSLGEKDVLKYNNIDYYNDGLGYIYKDSDIETVKLDRDIKVYSLSSLEKAIGDSNKAYNLVSKAPSTILKEVSSQSYCNVVRKNTLETYYNKDILLAVAPSNPSIEDMVLGTKSYDFTIKVYDDELDVEFIRGVLESFTYNKAYRSYEDIVKVITSALADEIEKFSISYGNYTYSYYDEVIKEGGTVKGIKNNNEEIPLEINTYNITDVEVIYDTLACALQNKWY